jgi:hypothetical protein
MDNVQRSKTLETEPQSAECLADENEEARRLPARGTNV